MGLFNGKKQGLLSLMLVMVIALTSGCTLFKKKAVIPSMEQACAMACDEKMTTCSKKCQNDCPKCQNSAENAAKMRYNRYKNQQCIQGEMITRELNSYRDPQECLKTTCDCLAEARLCLSTCSEKA